MDPLGCALIFYSLTLGMSLKQKVRTLLQALAVALGIILSFALFGERLLSAMGISMDSLRIAGGILLFSTAFKMITSVPHPEQASAVRTGSIIVYPLAIPLAAGPGTLTLTVLLMAKGESLIQQALVIAAAVIGLLMIFIFSVMSSNLRRWLGSTGDEIVQRLLGVILAALAIQFVASGIEGLFCPECLTLS
ncbi:MAG: MarC family protein [Reinekea sp.]